MECIFWNKDILSYDEYKIKNSVLSSLIFSLFRTIHVRMSETHAVILRSSSWGFDRSVEQYTWVSSA